MYNVLDDLTKKKYDFTIIIYKKDFYQDVCTVLNRIELIIKIYMNHMRIFRYWPLISDP